MPIINTEKVVSTLVKKGIINDSEKDNLILSCDIELSNDENNRLFFTFKFNNFIKPNAIYKIFKFLSNASNTSYKIEKYLENSNIDDFRQYLNFFCELNSVIDSKIIDCFKFNQIQIENNVIKFNVYDNLTKKNIEKISYSLVNFFKFSPYKIENIEINIDQKNERLELYKKERENAKLKEYSETKKIIETQKINNNIDKVISANNINNKNITKISTVLNSTDQSRYCIEGQIFQLESRVNKTGTTMFIFAISDYDDCITVKAMNTTDAEK
jgi:DNA polymerase III alpha subunit (gram-positive type)